MALRSAAVLTKSSGRPLPSLRKLRPCFMATTPTSFKTGKPHGPMHQRGEYLEEPPRNLKDLEFSLKNGIATIKLDRPHRLNALSEDMAESLMRLCEYITAAPVEKPLPTIACLSGPAFGWGLELALACDLRVAHPASLLCLPETSLGIFPGAGGVVLLRELVSPSIAKDLIFTARRFSGADALSLGVVNRVSPNVEENAEELAQCIAENGPLGVRGAKEVMEGAHNVDFGTAIALARQLRAPLSETEDFKEALQAFEEKRKPTFRGR